MTLKGSYTHSCTCVLCVSRNY